MFRSSPGSAKRAISRYMNGKVSPKQAAFYKRWLKDLLLNRAYMGWGEWVMGFLWSPVLWLRFALIRKFSVSQDNAAPLKNAFSATGVPGPRSASALGAGKMWVWVS